MKKAISRVKGKTGRATSRVKHRTERAARGAFAELKGDLAGALHSVESAAQRAVKRVKKAIGSVS